MAGTARRHRTSSCTRARSLGPRGRGARLAVAVLCLLLAPARLAAAHARLVQSDPPAGAALASSPPAVHLRFDEGLQPGLSDARVFDPSQRRLDRGDARVTDAGHGLTVSLPPLPKGTYVVVWKAVSAGDGHVTRGSFAFGVGERPGRVAAPSAAGRRLPLPLAAAVQAVFFAAGVGLFGTLTFHGLRARPGPGAAPGAAFTALATRTRRWAWSWWAVLAAAALGQLAAETADAAGAAGRELLAGPALVAVLLHSRFGVLWLARAAILLAAVPLIASVGRAALATRPWPALALAGAFWTAVALVSHAASAPSHPAVAVASAIMHLAGATLWLGAILYRASISPGAARTRADEAGEPAPPRATAPAGETRGEARLALPWVLGGVVAVLLSGVYNTLIHVHHLSSLLHTSYGRILFLKHAATLSLLAGALSAALAGCRIASPRAVRLAAGLALVVLALSGILSALPPPGAEGAPALVATREVQGIRVRLAIRPGQAGQNAYEVAVGDASGRPLPDVLRVLLRLTMRDMDMGTQVVVLQPDGDGRYRAWGQELGMEGRWRVEVVVRRRGREDAVVPVDLIVGAAPR